MFESIIARHLKFDEINFSAKKKKFYAIEFFF